MRIGIIIPVKYYPVIVPSGGMDPREADIEENKRFAEREGAVYWDLNILKGLCNREFRKKKGITFPTCCYFYNAERDELPAGSRVTHRAKLLASYSYRDFKEEKRRTKAYT